MIVIIFTVVDSPSVCVCATIRCAARQRIVAIWFTVEDANWRNQIDSALIRNNDAARRKRKGRASMIATAVTEKPLKRLFLEEAPHNNPAYEV